MPSDEELLQLLRQRIEATIPEGTGAEIKNLCDALWSLEGRPAGRKSPEGPLTVRFVGEAEEYSL